LLDATYKAFATARELIAVSLLARAGLEAQLAFSRNKDVIPFIHAVSPYTGLELQAWSVPGWQLA
jgi:hypothetical protein